MKVVIGSDHAGFPLKQVIVDYIKQTGREVLDVGTNNTDPVDYPDFAQAVAEAMVARKGDKGIVICGSGVGASVAANKVPGARAGLCHDTYSSHQGVEHVDMNVLVMGARVVGVALAQELVEAYLSAEFSQGERHVGRLKKVAAVEAKYSSGQKSEGAKV
jgi:ribose 5-phosphate isomerase B